MSDVQNVSSSPYYQDVPYEVSISFVLEAENLYDAEKFCRTICHNIEAYGRITDAAIGRAGVWEKPLRP